MSSFPNDSNINASNRIGYTVSPSDVRFSDDFSALEALETGLVNFSSEISPATLAPELVFNFMELETNFNRTQLTLAPSNEIETVDLQALLENSKSFSPLVIRGEDWSQTLGPWLTVLSEEQALTDSLSQFVAAQNPQGRPKR